MDNNGYAIKKHRNPDGSLKSRPQNTQFFFKPAVSWNKVGSGITSFRYRDDSWGFNDAAPSIFGEDLLSIQAMLSSKLFEHLLNLQGGTLNVTTGVVKGLPHLLVSTAKEIADRCVKLSIKDWDSFEKSWDFERLPMLEQRSSIAKSYDVYRKNCQNMTSEMKRLEEENNRSFIEASGLHDELTSDVPEEQITILANPKYRYGGNLSDEELEQRFREDTIQELISYAVGCMMGRYSLDKPGLIYAHRGSEGFDPDQYKTFPADKDGIVPVTDIDWFEDGSGCRFQEFVGIACPKEHLEENLKFVADSLGARNGESPRDTIRRYFANEFFKNHLKTYKRRPIYWLFSSGKLGAFQCLVYLHRYNESTLSRMRTEYVIPLQGKMAVRLEQLGGKDGESGDIGSATSLAHRKRLRKEYELLKKQQVELAQFDEKLRHYADQRIKLDLDDGVKVNYGKFGDLLAEVKTVCGKKEDND